MIKTRADIFPEKVPRKCRKMLKYVPVKIVMDCGSGGLFNA